ncbi:exosome complex component RRP43 isoform X3 [Mobula birostris]|uniref:exosome complex component RRP43 isoform X3 n=1 Tax=Mobula birostris TaxID=1983395 RepID=UPI003B27FE50
MAAGFKTVEPLEYYRKFLKENCRPDGRELGEFRTTTLNIGSITTADGSALVKLGNTTVVCGVKVEFAAPTVDAPNKGYVVPNVDLPPLCSSRFRPGPPGEQAQAASQFIFDVIENSQIIQKEDLCIEKGKLPSVSINEETGLAEVNMNQKNQLNIRKNPVATSFAIFDNTIFIVDPTAEEEALSSGMVTIVIDEEDRLCAVHKPGSTTGTTTNHHANFNEEGLVETTCDIAIHVYMLRNQSLSVISFYNTCASGSRLCTVLTEQPVYRAAPSNFKSFIAHEFQWK